MDKIETFGRIHYPKRDRDIIQGASLYSNEKGFFVEFEMPFTKQPDEIDLLWGDFNQLGYVTCVSNRLVGLKYGTGGNRCKYRISNLFSGAHFENEEELVFNHARFRVDSLSEWFNIRTIKHLSRPHGIEFGELKQINLEIPGFKKSYFSFGYNLSTSIHSTTIKEVVSFNLESENPQNFQNFYSTVIKMKQLFALLCEYPLDIEEVAFYNDSLKYVFNNEETDRRVEIILYDYRKPLDSCPTSGFLNIGYIDIVDNFAHMINQWLIISEDNIAIDLLMEKAYYKELSTRTYFLNLCMSLEILHKKYVSNRRFENEDLKEIKDHLESVVTLEKAKEWVANKQGLGNQPSLKDRLLYFEDDFRAISKMESSDLITRIVQTRNYITHSSAKKKHVIKDPLEQYLVSLTLETIIKGQLLLKMGLRKDDITKMYEKANAKIENIRRINKINPAAI